MTASRAYADRWQAPLLAALTVLDGQACPSNQILAALLGITAGQMDFALARAIRAGRLRREERHRSRRLIVVGEDGRDLAATNWSRAGGSMIEHRMRDAAVVAALAAVDDGAWPRVAVIEDRAADEAAIEARRVVRTRCPFCNMPPAHADCRHGWDGLTTAAARRAIAVEAGIVIAGGGAG